MPVDEYPAVFFQTSIGVTGTVYDFPTIEGHGIDFKEAAADVEARLIAHVEQLLEAGTRWPLPTWPGDVSGEMGGERGLVIFVPCLSA